MLAASHLPLLLLVVLKESACLSCFDARMEMFGHQARQFLKMELKLLSLPWMLPGVTYKMSKKVM